MEFYKEGKPNCYSGTVYDKGTGTPLASVAVSNGREVALTDECTGLSVTEM